MKKIKKEELAIKAPLIKCEEKGYFLLLAFGVTQMPSALHTTIGSSKKSAADGLTSVLDATTFLASNLIFLEVLPTS